MRTDAPQRTTTGPLRPRPLRGFVRDRAGFTGAEKALLACFALAVVSLVGYLVGGGSQSASKDAQRTLAQGRGALGGGAGLGQIMTPSALPQVSAPSAPAPSFASVTAPAAPAPVQARREPVALAEGQVDTAYDGAYVGAGGRAYPATTPISQVPPIRPSNGQAPNGTIVYVNGIQTTKETQVNSLQGIADTTGAQVIGIHNSTEGITTDLAQCLKDKAGMGHNPAVDTLASTVYDSITAGRPIHIMAHSQGGLITSRALSDVRRRLMIEDGMSRAQAERALSLVEVETFGAAAMTYPDGPQYVHYVNRFDLVPTQFGLGSTRLGNLGSGRGAVTRRFNAPRLNPIAAHSFDDLYLPRRVPFNQARGGR